MAPLQCRPSSRSLCGLYTWFALVTGTTLGMMLANAPVVWFGDRIMRRVPIRVVHIVSAAIFAALGVGALLWG